MVDSNFFVGCSCFGFGRKRKRVPYTVSYLNIIIHSLNTYSLISFRTLNLCGSSVSLEPIKAVLAKCPNINSINLQSCRALPRGIKRHYTGSAVKELKESLEEKPKTELTEKDADQLSKELTST